MKKITAFLLIYLLFSCKSDPVLFELTTSVNPLESGVISPNQGTVWLGDQIEVSAIPNTGYSFVKWSGDLNDSINPISLIIDSNKDIVAEFTEMTKIPDNFFEKYLIEIGIDDKLDGYVKTEEIEKITSLNLTNKEINDFTGIEDFINLKVLIADNNFISILDLSFNVELEILMLNDNLLESLDLSNNINLKILSLNNNSLTSLDLSLNLDLTDFSAINNVLLSCVKISNTQANISLNWNVDSGTLFNTSC